MNILDIAGRRCRLCGKNAPQCLLVQPIGLHEQETLSSEAEAISADTPMPFMLTAFEIADWECDLMPWNDPVVSKRPGTGSGASDTLHYLQDGLLPWLKGHYGEMPTILGGYSLAGLFALWATRECNAFAGVAAASPSVWIRGWLEYAEVHPMQARQVYLSLGEREEKTRNRAIATVGDRIRSEHAMLKHQLGEENCILEWNPGGHFADYELRTARAFAWNLERFRHFTRLRNEGPLEHGSYGRPRE